MMSMSRLYSKDALLCNCICVKDRETQLKAEVSQSIALSCLRKVPMLQ